METYTISPIASEDEGKTARAVALKVFGKFAGLLMPSTPRWGFYAHGGEEVVGGVFISQLSEKEGVLSWIFVDPKAQGHRLGARLLEAGIEAMETKGLTTQFALVKGDNTASWNMFAKNGYVRPSVWKSLFGYSPKSFMTRLGYAMAGGYNTWVKDPSLNQTSIHPKRFAVVRSLLFSLFVGMALSLFSLRGLEFFALGTAMVAGITALRMIVAYPFARSYGPVRFDPPQGGTPLSVVLALAFSTWWPSFGTYVPKKDIWKDREFLPYNGAQAFAAWMSMVGVYVIGRLALPAYFSGGRIELFLALVMGYNSVPFYPFDGMDGAKVLKYSKLLYGIGLAAMVSALLFV